MPRQAANTRWVGQNLKEVGMSDNICAISVSDFAPSTRINSIFLVPDNSPINAENYTLSVNLSLEESITGRDALSWMEQPENFQHFRFRLIACTRNDLPTGLGSNVHSLASALDFISQRFNEYNTLIGAAINMSPENYIQNLNETLETNGDRLMNDDGLPRLGINPGQKLRNLYMGKHMPFNNSHDDLPHAAPNDDCRFYDNDLKHIVVYDRPVVDMLPPLESGRLSPQNIEEVKTSDRRSEQTFVYRKVNLDPATVHMGTTFQIEKVSNHLSVYAFVYFDYASYVQGLEGVDVGDRSVNVPVIIHGMGNISTATVIGEKTIFEPLLGVVRSVQEGEILTVEDGVVVEANPVSPTAISNWGMV